jgi:lactoylglutathione lyase
MEIRLLVLRTGDTTKLADFYSLLGLAFSYHSHGNLPFHYSTMVGSTVLEIYPLTKSQAAADENLRLGFGIDNFDVVVEKLKERNVTFLTEPVQTDFGFMAVVEDPDNRKVELYRKQLLSPT